MNVPSRRSLRPMWKNYYDKVPSDVEQELVQPLAHSNSDSAQRLTTSWCKKRARSCGGVSLRRQIETIAICVAYTVVGPSVIVVNNHIIKTLHFPYPLTLSLIGLFTTACCCAFVLRVLPWVLGLYSGLKESEPDKGLGQLATEGQPCGGMLPVLHTRFSYRFWFLNMVPIGLAQGVTFACGNAAYMYLTITFTQMLSAFTPTVTLVLLYLTGIEVPTTRASIAVLLIGFGCAVSSYGEGNFHVVGVAFRCLGILTEATRLVLTQKLLKHHNLNIIESQYYLAPIGAFILLAGAAFTELPRAMEAEAWATLRDHPTPFVASAVLGLAASFMTFLVIKVTNSVTLKVLNTARNAAFVLFTVAFLHEEASALQMLGYSMSLTAFSFYTYCKINNM